MPNNEDEWIDELLATHRSETWSTGWNNAASDKAKAAIQAKQIKAQLDTIDKVYELSPTGTFNNWKPVDALRFYERLKAYEHELQASAPTKKGEDHA